MTVASFRGHSDIVSAVIVLVRPQTVLTIIGGTRLVVHIDDPPAAKRNTFDSHLALVAFRAVGDARKTGRELWIGHHVLVAPVTLRVELVVDKIVAGWRGGAGGAGGESVRKIRFDRGYHRWREFDDRANNLTT